MKITINSEADMKQLGEKLGALLVGGEIIELVGDIGAGKTTLTKGIAAGMGINETVQSPTFTISRVYDTPGGLTLGHYDFYRLSNPGIMADELSESSSDPQRVTIIEWGDIVRDVLPADHIRIGFASPAETVRILTHSAKGERGMRLLEEISK